ncbi:phosphate-repressible phosphate permease, putative, partial [Trypanosoma cruzi]
RCEQCGGTVRCHLLHLPDAGGGVEERDANLDFVHRWRRSRAWSCDAWCEDHEVTRRAHHEDHPEPRLLCRALYCDGCFVCLWLRRAGLLDALHHWRRDCNQHC